ncbi:MAG: hypothetical protein WB607_19720 [Candidatus Acidiferrum sp.]|jgi:hypothetical protein
MKADHIWEELCEAAVLETDDKKLPNRLHAAKAAIDKRLEELQRNDGGTPVERQAMSKALAGLNLLRRELETRSQAAGSSNA